MNISLSILSGLCISLSFPKFYFTFLIWLSFVPLFFIIKNSTSYRQLFLYGAITSITLNIIGFYWIAYVSQEFGHLPLWISILILLLYAMFSCLHIPIFLILTKYLSTYLKCSLFWIAPITFTACEFINPQLFPWYIGNSLLNYTTLIQFIDITGVLGLSFLIVLTNALIFEILLFSFKKHYRFCTKELITFIILMIPIIIYGNHSIQKYSALLKNETKTLKYAIIQANIGNFEKAAAENKDEDAMLTVLDKNTKLTIRSLLDHKTDFIIWPETSYPFTFNEGYYNTPISNVIKTNKQGFIFGGFNQKMDKNKNLQIYNSLFILSKDQKLSGDYDKRYLLAFGEYFPFSDYLPSLKYLIPEISDFARGGGPKIIDSDGIRFGPLICYEAIITSFVRNLVLQGASVLINLTNDSWFGNSSCPFQHRDLAAFRSIEHRRPLIRSTNTGLSVTVDILGRFQKEGKFYDTDTLVDEIKITSLPMTYYTRKGDWLPWGCVILSLLFLMTSRFNYIISHPKRS